MGSIEHLSMRVPWRDRPWDDKVCDRPLANTSCLLLPNIGEGRNDELEAENAGAPIGVIQDSLPCLSERATFMSDTGYTLTKKHPYAGNKQLGLQPSPVSVPPYAMEAVPFRWMNRDTALADLDAEWSLGLESGREDAAYSSLGFTPGWLMDSVNQRRSIDGFFEPVEPSQSLVFFYLKFSPFQDVRTDRLLVGAALVDQIDAPPLWNRIGSPPFESSMWETIVHHSLRPEMTNGILLPYQKLAEKLDSGADVDACLAWAPSGKTLEFSYTTEHVSDDSAIDALQSLAAAAQACQDLDLILPPAAVEWVDAQIARLWNLRGAHPGLAPALAYLKVSRSHAVARHLTRDQNVDPWEEFASWMGTAAEVPAEFAGCLPPSVRASWKGLEVEDRDALARLSEIELTPEQLAEVMAEETPEGLEVGELVENPYWLPWATYRSVAPISITAVDRACFPSPTASWAGVGRLQEDFSDPHDRRRVEAMLVEVLERAAANGDTLVPQVEVIEAINALPFDSVPAVTGHLLAGLDLDCTSLEQTEDWTAVVGARLQNGDPALKLTRLQEVRTVVAEWIDKKLKQKRFAATFDADEAMNAVLPAIDEPDGEEVLARKEKSACLAELFSSRMSVLVGAAGTGKTTLLKALVGLPDVKAKGVLLLAPTGKARVQLEKKVGLPARTLASYLIPFGAYDGETGVYWSCEPTKRTDAGLVVIDEASMLTEEMLAAVVSTLGMVDRLVLVGDPRQLPPIGAGRPFVDLVEKLRPNEKSSALRVGPGYCELQVIRRQTTGGDADAEQRDDLTLASWFGGGDLPGDADGVWERLRSGVEMPTLEAIQVADGDFTKALMRALRGNLDLKAHEDREYAFKLSYGAGLSPDGKWINWKTGKGGGGDRCEDWQILSPTRTRAFGTLEINRFVKRTFRQKDLQAATRGYGWRSARPVGPEQIVLGDKVVQTVNNSRARAYPKGAGLDYVANGEIGVVVGPWHNSSKQRPAQVEFSSQVGATYSYWKSRDDPPLELAWAVTVHKSQGSEFGTTFVVLPEKVRVSRELLYTALTRQSNKVVLLHEGDINALREIADASRSETARRLTDLFRAPAPRMLPTGDTEGRFDANLIHVASTGILVRSKNEVIVADILDQVAPGTWQYEKPLLGTDGSQKLPDFTVETSTGDIVFWEHLGMMNNPRYAQAWEAKKSWYRDNGVRPFDEPDADDSRGVLMWTDDLTGVDQPAWRALAESVIGAPSASPAGRRSKRRK